MKALSVVVAGFLLCLPLLTSCSTLRFTSVKKSPAITKSDWATIASEGLEPTESWADKHVPGWKRLSRLFPEPSEGRREWDQWQRRKQNPWPNEFTGK